MDQNFLIYNLILFAATLAVGLLTLIKKWDDEPLHLFVSYGAGIFLGVVFLHFLPESLAEAESLAVPAMVLVGFLLIFFVEKFFLMRGDGGVVHEHKAVAITALLGLTVHSIIEGMGLALLNSQHEFGAVLFYSILAHNIPAAISLASLFLLSRMRKSSVVVLLLVFSISTPGAALVSYFIFSSNSHLFVELLTALTAGSLLYVATGELLPEVFHTKANKWGKLALLLLGIITIVVVSIYYH